MSRIYFTAAVGALLTTVDGCETAALAMAGMEAFWLACVAWCVTAEKEAAPA